MSVNRLIFVGLSGGMIVLISFLTTCQSSTEEVSNITEGERLARIRCASCHLFPEPALLSQSAWENGVLPQMAYYFGLITKNRTPYKNISIEEYQNLKQSGVFPDEPSISKEEWAAIRDYYLSNAPEQPALIDHKISAPAALNLFTPQPIHLRLKEGPLTTMVHFDSQGQNIYISDLRDTLYKVDINGKVQSKTKLLSLISDMSVREDNTQYLLAMGNIHPKDNPLGHLLYRDISGNISSIMEGLHRPVDIERGDLNQDGLEDLVICTYGHTVGHFSWYEQTGTHQFEEHRLSDLPGAIKSYIHDFNDDQLPDIITLMGQGDEGIFIYYNKGNNQFEVENVLRFHPLFGSSFFDLVDYEEDGDLDILLANGDNADYSAIPKKFHGIRLFLNNGQNKFEEAFFYPMYGATKALLRDFDKDGDKDIAAIAYFPEYRIAPEEGFIFLDNTNADDFKFSAATFENATLGRWLNLEAADIDRDGDDDLLLGSLYYAPTPSPAPLQNAWISNGPNALILENQTIK